MLTKIKESVHNFHGRNAFHINKKFYSYLTFAEIVSKIRFYLENNCNDSEKLIGILTNDDIETYCSVFGILYAGKGFVPINPNHPFERNISVIKQSGLKVILASNGNNSFQKFAAKENIKLISTKKLPPASINLEVPIIDENNIAYVLFTSGSTGIPKGVQLTMKNLKEFVNNFFKLGYKIDKSDRFLQMFEMTFDLSIICYVIPLCIGACVYTVPGDGIKFSSIYCVLEEEKITFALMVPSILSYLKPYFNEIKLNELKYSLFCGEALYSDLVKDWLDCVQNAEVQNVYGPTEATIFCLTYPIPKDKTKIKSFNGIVSIGKPMDNMESIIIDEGNKIITDNEKGELSLSGNQLTNGYLNNPVKNKESFFIFNENSTAKRFYRTGDISFIDNDGDFMYCGRKDNQIKIQGFRIELGEIEHHARNFTKVTKVFAVPVEKSTGGLQIYLFIENYSGNINEITEYLKTKIPQYMMPSKITSISDFPLNSNGKIDRKSLIKIVANLED
ncbi:MAG: AMP-binding protein [Bacteroidetes bacterium]|nr:AMP-binding protein [Bacteroidota bacterium]